jgi:hypothetical protein
MLQYQLQKSSVSGNCQYVQQLKDLGLDAPPIDPNASITANGTTLPAPKKKELPPMPTKNNTRPVLLMDNGASSSTLAAATGLIGTVACVFGFLL